ncbi:MAG: SpoIID/LytB domain-containing protein, partial [Bradymonadaceae bacterium]
MTGTPIREATIRVLGTDKIETTDEDGHWQFELPEGTYELEVEVTLGDDHHEFRVVNQRVPQYKEADTRLPTTHFLDRGVPARERPLGAPVPRIDDPAVPDGGEVDLTDLPRIPPETGPRDYTIPDSPPMTIRVAIRDDHSTCRNSPIVAIEEMPLDEYVKGVLAPEIGVFRNQTNAIEVFKAFAPAAKSYGLWFLLRYGPGNRRSVSNPKPPHDYEWFHIDNTPCNQRYSDMRFETSDRGADAMKDKLLVKEGAPDTLDKFEYAASCGGHGTRPEYQNAIVSDDSSTHSCVGDWCGHDDCAGHADHPNVDDSCGCCLVRGICQWGALEWAESGRDGSWILDHYQPNLVLRSFGQNQPMSVELTGFVHTNPDDIAGSGLSEATVSLSDGQQ